jgi:heptosyltransferase-2
MSSNNPDDKMNRSALESILSKVSVTTDSLFPAQNILVLPLPGVGDTLNACSTLGVLRKVYPEANITVVVMFKSAADVVENHPAVDEVIYKPFIKEGAWNSLKFLASLRKRRFDLSVLIYPANRAEYNIVSLLTGARMRLAHRYNHRTWRSLFFLNSRTILEDDLQHNVEENVRLLSLIGIHAKSWDKPRIWLTDDDRGFARSWIIERKLDSKLLIAFHPGCATFKNQVKRRWGMEKYVELGRRLVQEEGAHILVFGGTREDELKTMVARQIGDGADAVYESTMRQAAALIAQCQIMVSGDTGLMHVAGAVDVPVVAVYGPTNVNWVYPYGATYKIVTKNLPCSPCFYYSTRHLSCDAYGDFRCITQITVDEVYEETRRLLHASSSK